MTSIAKEKMPHAVLLCHDFSKGIPEELSGLQFDYIVSTYASQMLPLYEEKKSIPPPE